MNWKSIKHFLAGALTTALLTVSIAPGASAASAADFKDVSDSYKSAVDYLVTENITNGVSEGLFGTDQPIKRADAAIWVVKALGYDHMTAPDAGFTDVPGRADNAVNLLAYLGVVHGKTEESFGAQDVMTRAEMAKIMTVAFELPIKGTAHPFRDVSATFSDYVQAIYHAGLTSGKSSTLYGANDPIKRGEFAIFLQKADQYVNHGPEPLILNVKAEILEDNKIKVTGEAEDVNKVMVVFPGANEDCECQSFEAEVVNGVFTVTTNMPEDEISEIVILDEEGNPLYAGVAYEME